MPIARDDYRRAFISEFANFIRCAINLGYVYGLIANAVFVELLKRESARLATGLRVDDNRQREFLTFGR